LGYYGAHKCVSQFLGIKKIDINVRVFNPLKNSVEFFNKDGVFKADLKLKSSIEQNIIKQNI